MVELICGAFRRLIFYKFVFKIDLSALKMKTLGILKWEDGKIIFK